MSVSARMKVTSVLRGVGCDQVKMAPVYSSDPADPNYSYSKYTPSGSLELAITNPDLIGKIEPGTVYDLTLTAYQPEAASNPADASNTDTDDTDSASSATSSTDDTSDTAADADDSATSDTTDTASTDDTAAA